MKIKLNKYFALGTAVGSIATVAIITPIAISYKTPTVPKDKTNPVGTSTGEINPVLPQVAQKINYNHVRELLAANNLNDVSKINRQLKKMNFQNMITPKARQLTPDQLKKVHELQGNYLNYFEGNNFNSKQVVSYLEKKFPRYASAEQNANKDLENAQKKFFFQDRKIVHHAYFRSELDYNDDLSDVRNIFASLENARNSALELSIAASVAAAGYGAASGGFGISIPGAIASTAIAVANTTAATGMYIKIGQWEKYLRKIDDFSSNSYNVATRFYKTVSLSSDYFGNLRKFVKEEIKLFDFVITSLELLKAVDEANVGAFFAAIAEMNIVDNLIDSIDNFFNKLSAYEEL